MIYFNCQFEILLLTMLKLLKFQAFIGYFGLFGDPALISDWHKKFLTFSNLPKLFKLREKTNKKIKCKIFFYMQKAKP